MTAAGLRAATADFGRALAGCILWTALATVVAVVVRSTAAGVGLLLVWAGPFEHLVGDSWGTAQRWFPELLIETLIAAGSPDVTVARAATLATVYAVVALAVAFFVFSRRDIVA